VPPSRSQREGVETHCYQVHGVCCRVRKQGNFQCHIFIDLANFYRIQLCAPGDTASTDLSITDDDKVVSSLPGGAPLRDESDTWNEKVALRVDMLMLEQVEALEDRVANASMQVKGWKVPPRVSTDEDVKFRASSLAPEDEDDDRQDPVMIAKERLADLEAAIERRYLKPPLGTR